MNHRKIVVVLISIALPLGLIAGLWFTPDKPGNLDIQLLESGTPQEVLAGREKKANYRLTNRTGRMLKIKAVKTGCGCAMLSAGGKDVLGTVIPSGAELDVTLTVDTSARSGRTVVPFEVVCNDRYGKKESVQTNYTVNVNPGSAITRTSLTLDAKNAVEQVVADEIVLFQTSESCPFAITEASTLDPAIRLVVSEISTAAVGQFLPTSESSTIATNRNVVPRFLIRITTDVDQIEERRSEEVAFELSHGLNTLRLPVELIPKSLPIRVVPKILHLDSNSDQKITKEIIVSSDADSEQLNIVLPNGVTLASKEKLEDFVLKLRIDINPEKLEDDPIKISDPAGNSAQVVLDRLD